ncbi:MAG TPA: DUF2147 domain-containing protein [Xanthobacteraceae bacterium]|nr:DUF2147 domain-containing protein [Xanthobacteraceae bacterium]
MRTKLLTGFAALLSIVIGSHAVSADMSPVGLWQATDPDTKQPTGWFFIGNNSGVYDGTLVKMFLGPGEDPNIVCDKCKDDRHDQPWLGLQIIRGMKPDGDNKYRDGTILDPRDGNVYSAMMTLSPDGQTLTIRGYLGIALLGRNEYWTRLPDSDYGMLDPSIKSALGQSMPPNAPAPGTTPSPHANSTHH